MHGEETLGRNVPRVARKPFFYGYWIVAAAFCCTFVASGCGFYGFSLFVKSLQAELGWARAEAMLGVTVYFLVVGLASPSVGRLVDRYGASKVIASGALVMGLGFVLLSRLQELWHFYAAYVVVGAGASAIGAVPSSALVANWFKRRRGFAIGVMAAGVGGGGFVMSPLIGGFLIPTVGWEKSYLALAVVDWLLIPLALLVVKTRPADMGLFPDGDAAPESPPPLDKLAGASAAPVGDHTLKTALATLPFWLIAGSYLFNAFAQVGTLQNQVPHLEDIGFPVTTAATAFGAVSLASLFGKFGFGWLCDKIPAKYAWCLGIGLQIAGTGLLMAIRPGSPMLLVWLYALVMGLGVGGWLPTLSMLISGHFGLASYGAIFGTIFMVQNVGCAVGPFAAGYIYDTRGSYFPAFLVFLALDILAIPIVLAVRRPRKAQDAPSLGQRSKR